MVRTVIYTPHRENLHLATALIDRAKGLDVRHVTQLPELDRTMREHDCEVVVIFAPRRIADVGQMLMQSAPYIMRWNIAVSIVGNPPTIEQFKRLQSAAITDYSILPLGPRELTQRLTRAVMERRKSSKWGLESLFDTHFKGIASKAASVGQGMNQDLLAMA
jgi:hypothetical protein